jgi:carbonic anhydrase
MSAFYENLFKNNEKWVERKVGENPDFFKEHAKGQKPPLLWIGCSDSRVPANDVIGADVGEVFVHRNIANMVLHSDMNALSVLDYAVNALQVPHIVVCGHYGCGGVKAAMGDQPVGLIDNWLRHIKDTYRFNNKEIDAIKNDDERFDRYVELNTEEQVKNLAKSSIVQNAWKSGQDLKVHGWVYDLKTGKIKDLKVDHSKADNIGKNYQLDF